MKKKKKKKKSATDRRGVSVLLLPSFLSHRISKGYMPLRRRSNPRSLSPRKLLPPTLSLSEEFVGFVNLWGFFFPFLIDLCFLSSCAVSMLSSHAYGSFSLETPETLDV